MSKAETTEGGRREFFRACARYGAVSLAAVGAWLASPGNPAKDAACVNNGLCRGCGSFPTCPLPQALSTRQNVQRSLSPPDAEKLAAFHERRARLKPKKGTA